jgi:hypothetical protein
VSAVRKPGRPTSLTEAVGRAIIARVELIGFVATAAEREGISRSTVYSWIERGESGEEEFAWFATGLAKAKATYIETHLDKVHDSKWKLEKVDREQFGQQAELKLSGEIALQDYRNMSTDELKRQALAAAEGKEEPEP